MPFKFPITVAQVLWTLTFAAQLTLLVVLLGRDRVKRYPWFTASIVLFALRLLVEVLLGGRLAAMPLRTAFVTIADCMALCGLLVVVEMARRAFAGAKNRTWAVGALVTIAIGGVVLATWGPWPQWRAIAFNSPLAVLALMQLFAQKADLLMDVLTIELGVLIVLFGRRFQAGWRSHTQRIVIGLSTVAISWLSVQGIWQLVATHAHPTSQEEYERIIGLGGKLVNANKVVYIAALIWWIVNLWSEERGSGTPVAEPVLTEPAEQVEIAASIPVEPPQIAE